MDSKSVRMLLSMQMIVTTLLVLVILGQRFETRIAEAGGGGGHQGSEGWIAWSGQKTDGQETVFLLNTKRGQPHKMGKYTFNDNGPRLAVYRISNEGTLKLSSMRNVGPDVDEYLLAFNLDKASITVSGMREEQLKARELMERGEEELPVDTNNNNNNSGGGNGSGGGGSGSGH